MDACELSARGDVDALRALPIEALSSLDAKGSAPVHWAASCGQLDALKYLLHEGGCDAAAHVCVPARAFQAEKMGTAWRPNRNVQATL